MLSAKCDILGRYGKFSRALRSSIRQEIRVLFNIVVRDIRSTTSRNLNLVKKKSGLDPISTGTWKMKEALCQAELVEILAQDMWRMDYTKPLLS